MPPPAAVQYKIQDIKAESRYEKANEVYLHFTVQGQPGVKAKTSVLPHDNETYAWLNEVLDLEVQEPVNAILEVEAYSKRTLLPDHSIGQFTQPLPQPGATETFKGVFVSSKGAELGSAKFTVLSAALTGTAAEGGAPNRGQHVDTGVAGAGAGTIGSGAHFAGDSTASRGISGIGTAGQSDGTGTLQQTATPGAGTAAAQPASIYPSAAGVGAAAPHSTHGLHGTHGGAGTTADEARARSNAVAQKASAKTSATSGAAQAKTVNAVDGAEDRLQNFKEGLSHENQPSRSQVTHPSVTKGQGAYNEVIGLPRDAQTALDAPGTGSSVNPPYDAASGGSVGAKTGPVAPTGQGGILSETGATSAGIQPGGMATSVKNVAYNAADKAQGALDTAKRSFKGGSTT